MGVKSVRFNIAWRSSVFSLVDAHTLSVPYAGGSRIEMPVVLLESTTTGRRAWFANFHNPADTPHLGNNARWRAEGDWSQYDASDVGIQGNNFTGVTAGGGGSLAWNFLQSGEFFMDLRRHGVRLPDPPQRGTLDLNQVLKSDYFFS